MLWALRRSRDHQARQDHRSIERVLAYACDYQPDTRASEFCIHSLARRAGMYTYSALRSNTAINAGKKNISAISAVAIVHAPINANT